MSYNRVSPGPDLQDGSLEQQTQDFTGEKTETAAWSVVESESRLRPGSGSGNQTTDNVYERSSARSPDDIDSGKHETFGSKSSLKETDNGREDKDGGQSSVPETQNQTGNGTEHEQLKGSGTTEQKSDPPMYDELIRTGTEFSLTDENVNLPDNSNLYQQEHLESGTPKVISPQKEIKYDNGKRDTFEMQEVSESRLRLRARSPKIAPAAESHYVDVIIGAGGGEEGEGEIGCCGWALTILSFILIVMTIPFSIFFCIKVVQEYERAVIFRLGRLLSGGAKGPGIFFIYPCIESYTKVDLRTVSFDVPPQEILTKDSVTVSVDAVVYYRVSNPTVSIANVENAHHATRLLAQTTLRNILGTKNLTDILTEREAISVAMQTVLDGATDRWGIKVERVEIKDVRLPLQLQRAMAAEAEASREARAKVLAAEGEHLASRSLREAAETISQSPAAIQLRYLQTLNSISAEKNSTIIFPLPIDLIKSFMGGDVSKKSNSKSSTII